MLARVVAAPDGRVASSSFANPALGTGGTGDVLAGVIGSLLAQGVPTWEAACLGVHLHGVAGEHIRDRLGDAGLIASDLLGGAAAGATRAPAPSVERRATHRLRPSLSPVTAAAGAVAHHHRGARWRSGWRGLDRV